MSQIPIQQQQKDLFLVLEFDTAEELKIEVHKNGARFYKVYGNMIVTHDWKGRPTKWICSMVFDPNAEAAAMRKFSPTLKPGDKPQRKN